MLKRSTKMEPGKNKFGNVSIVTKSLRPASSWPNISCPNMMISSLRKFKPSWIDCTWKIPIKLLLLPLKTDKTGTRSLLIRPSGGIVRKITETLTNLSQRRKKGTNQLVLADRKSVV